MLVCGALYLHLQLEIRSLNIILLLNKSFLGSQSIFMIGDKTEM